MTGIRIPSTVKQLASLVKGGEGATLEFKRSTGELKGAMQTLCAFLNGAGGMVLFGVTPDGAAVGQIVSDQTLRDIAQAADRLEPPAHVSIHRIKVKGDCEVVALSVGNGPDVHPFTYEGRAYERVGSTTRRMPQTKYEKSLLDRAHSKRRWENEPAEGLTLKNLDQTEILRTRELAIQQNRIPPDASRDIGDILDRLGLRADGILTKAALMLYGTRFLPDYPQCLLKMGRFRGTTITGEIVDNRQERMNAFAMVREGMAFLERTMPLGARFPKGTIFREDRFPVPLEALREILLNAVMHRDYSHYAGYVAIVIFDDRIEIQSYGGLPSGVTLEQLSGPHLSKPTNPLIAEAFHRTGAVEIWGRGTNRVIAECARHGIAPPIFEERQGFVVVTFKAALVTAAVPGMVDRESSQKSSQKGTQKSSQKILDLIRQIPAITIEELSTELGISDRAVKKHLHNLKESGRLKRIGPDKGGHWEAVK